MMDSNVYNPSIPFTGPLPSPLQPGNLIRISGTVGSSASCFSINLQNGTNDGQRSDIALHLSPVFSPPPRLVRNSLENQNWGPEESHGSCFPFSCGQGFEILILIEVDHFKIAVDGQHFTEFHYRLPLHSISHISIDGDVSINFIKFEGVSKSPMDSRPSEGLSKPLGFVIDSNNQQNLASPTVSGRSPSPYDSSALPYPSTFGPSPTTPYAPQTTSNLYPPPSAANPYGPSPNYNPYGPPPQGNMYPSGRVSPNPYGPPPSGGPSPYQYPQPQQGYPSHQQGYPQQAGGYPSSGYPSQGYPSSNPYPSQPGPYPGTSVVYPGQEKKGDSGMNLGPIAAAGAAALAGMAGSALIGGKHGKHKKSKHGHGMGSMLGGVGPGGLVGGVSSLLGGNKHGHSGSSGIPIGGAVAGGAAALAGAYMLSKSPMGKILKPKKMKKHKWGGYSSSSSSSSSDEE